jgi:pyridoxamine 5'-phosphate oxidase
VSEPRLATLAEVEAAVWQELVRASQDKHHAWRLPVLATADAGVPDARTVVLREVQPEQQELLIYTDARSPKVRQLQAQPTGVLVMWSAALSWQLRLRVNLALETSGLRLSSRWARLGMSAAANDYLAPLPPGTAIGQPLVPARDSRNHFALITARVVALDWLELSPSGHRRALFGDQEGARWVTP